jgi:diacylglycerol kinase family enzyme
MRAAALLSPKESLRHLRNFRRPHLDLVIAPDLRPGDRFDAVLIFGGDGSVHRHLAEVVRMQTPTLVVPTGSGNDFAHAIGIRNRQRALAAWQRFCEKGDNVRAVDVAEIRECAGAEVGVAGGTPALRSEKGSPGSPTPAPQEHVFCCVAGCGVDSETNRRANAMPRWLRSHGGYVLGVAGAAFSFRPRRITVTFESGGAISEPALMAAFANAPAYGHGMRIAPGAELDDGQLEVVFVRRAGPLRLLRLFPRVYFGRHLGLPEVECRRASWLRVESERPLDIYGDGEFLCRTPVEVRVRPRAFRVIVA